MEWKENNALRAAARAAIKEIDAEWKAAGVIGVSTSAAAKKRDKIAIKILDLYTARLAPRFTKMQLVYTIGVIKGTLKERN